MSLADNGKIFPNHLVAVVVLSQTVKYLSERCGQVAMILLGALAVVSRWSDLLLGPASMSVMVDSAHD